MQISSWCYKSGLWKQFGQLSCDGVCCKTYVFSVATLMRVNFCWFHGLQDLECFSSFNALYFPFRDNTFLVDLENIHNFQVLVVFVFDSNFKL